MPDLGKKLRASFHKETHHGHYQKRPTVVKNMTSDCSTGLCVGRTGWVGRGSPHGCRRKAASSQQERQHQQPRTAGPGKAAEPGPLQFRKEKSKEGQDRVFSPMIRRAERADWESSFSLSHKTRSREHPVELTDNVSRMAKSKCFFSQQVLR